MSFIKPQQIETSLKQAIEFYNDHILPRLTKKNKVVAISTAVALSVYLYVNRKITPPKKLRHIPYVGYGYFLKSIFNKISHWEKASKKYLPIIEAPRSNGIYMTPYRTGWLVHIANPVDAKYVLMNQDKFPKADILTGLEETLGGKFMGGPSIVTLNGAHWKSQRMIATPAFRRALPVKLFGRLAMDLFKVMDESDSVVDFTDLMERWTLDAIGNAGFGFDFKAITEKENEWVNTYNAASKGMLDPFFFLLPVFDLSLRWMFPKREAVHRDMDKFLNMLDQMILQKREAIKNGTNKNSYLEENEKDLLTLMIEGETKGDGAMSNRELKSNLAIFFLAGHDTTSSALSFAIYYLAKYPKYQQKAREEALAILGDDAYDVVPTVEQTKAMSFINQIIKETLRINPPAIQSVSRVASEDVTLSNTFIPKGSYVTVDFFHIQHSNKVWENGTEFNPERFAENGEAAQMSSEGYQWLPFGNGPRQCIGMNFSLSEQRVLLSMLLKKYTWTLPENSAHKDDMSYKGIMVVGPNKLEMKFEKRY